MNLSSSDGSRTIVCSTSPSNNLVYSHFYADIPYPSPADRRDLENLVKTNWDSKVQKPLGQAADDINHELHHAREWVFDT